MYNTFPVLSISFGLLVFQTAIFARQKNYALNCLKNDCTVCRFTCKSMWGHTCENFSVIFKTAKGPVLELPPLKDDTVGIFENINMTFWLNVSGCKQSDTIYKLKVTIKTNTGDSEEAGHLAVTNDTCSITDRESLHCVSPVGPVLLSRKVNRSHTEMEWEWHWKDGSTFINDNRTVKLNVSYPPSVTNMTVESQEVKGHYVVNKSQKVIIVCSFDKGNPPATFHLLAENRRELNNVSRAERELIHSLPAGQCEQPWPVVRCEAQGSSENRSVTFLVRCPPQFMDVAPKQIDPNVDDQVMFSIKAHTTEVAGCCLTSKSLGENSSREVTCSLSGNPPDLFLSLRLQKKDRAIRGNWTLTVSNEIGTGNTTVIFQQDYGATTESFGEKFTAYITFPLCGVVLIIAVMIFLAIYRKRIKKYGGIRSTPGSTDYRDDAERRFSSMMVNDLYETSGGLNLASADTIRSDADHLSRTHYEDPADFLQGGRLEASRMSTRPPCPEQSLSRFNGQNIVLQYDRNKSTNAYASGTDARERKKMKKTGNPLLGTDGNAYISGPEIREQKRLKKQDNRNYEGEHSESARNPAKTTEMPSTSGRRNPEGLIYGDLDFATNLSPDVIISRPSETEYAHINATAIVPPPRDYKRKISRRNEN